MSVLCTCICYTGAIVIHVFRADKFKKKKKKSGSLILVMLFHFNNKVDGKACLPNATSLTEKIRTFTQFISWGRWYLTEILRRLPHSRQEGPAVPSAPRNPGRADRPGTRGMGLPLWTLPREAHPPGVGLQSPRGLLPPQGEKRTGDPRCLGPYSPPRPLAGLGWLRRPRPPSPLTKWGPGRSGRRRPACLASSASVSAGASGRRRPVERGRSRQPRGLRAPLRPRRRARPQALGRVSRGRRRERSRASFTAPSSSSFSLSPSGPLPAGWLRSAAGRAGPCGVACPRPSALAAGPSGGGVTAAAAGGSEGKGCSPSILRAGYSAILDPRDKKIHAVSPAPAAPSPAPAVAPGPAAVPAAGR